MSNAEHFGQSDPTSPLDRFIACTTDEERLALGLRTLQAARNEAATKQLIGWELDVREYVEAIESGKGLNRPL